MPDTLKFMLYDSLKSRINKTHVIKNRPVFIWNQGLEIYRTERGIKENIESK